MKKMITLSIAALMSTATLGMAAPAAAQNGYYDRDGYSSYNVGYDRYDRRYDRRDYRNDYRNGYRNDYRNDRRYYRGDRRYYRQCDRGTGGTVIGAIAGGLAGNELAGRGDRAVGTILGGAVGAIAGRAIDRGNNGCR
ncbi:MAG: glycine zipper 2TM domain-containing protein [Sphingopyxis sp.]|nr:glycine zipper 2TM domain-containing protein [Sphingopyxis sp.]